MDLEAQQVVTRAAKLREIYGEGAEAVRQAWARAGVARPGSKDRRVWRAVAARLSAENDRAARVRSAMAEARRPQCFGAADDQPTVCNDCYVVEGDVPELGPRPTEPCS